MLVFGSGLMTLMMIVVVPKVTGIFASLDRALPWYTAVLIFVSSTLSSNQMLGIGDGPLVTLTFIAAGDREAATEIGVDGDERSSSGLGLVTFWRSSSSPWFWYCIGESSGGIVLGFLVVGVPRVRCEHRMGRLWRDGWLLKLPLFGPIFRMLAVVTFLADAWRRS